MVRKSRINCWETNLSNDVEVIAGRMIADDSTEPWDKGVRSKRYSIVTKRERFEQFQQSPTRDTLYRFARSWWAARRPPSFDYHFNSRLLGGQSRPADILTAVRAVAEGNRSITGVDIPGVGVATLTEVLEVAYPERFATLNSKSHEGMVALGYDVPSPNSLYSDNRYRKFVKNVHDAVDKFDLRESIDRFDSLDLPDDVPDVDVAQMAFLLHDEGRLDLGQL